MDQLKPSPEEFRILVIHDVDRLPGKEKLDGSNKVYFHPGSGKEFQLQSIRGFNQWSCDELTGSLGDVLMSIQGVGARRHESSITLSPEEANLLEKSGFEYNHSASKSIRELTGRQKDSYTHKSTKTEITIETIGGSNRWACGRKNWGTLRDVLKSYKEDVAESIVVFEKFRRNSQESLEQVSRALDPMVAPNEEEHKLLARAGYERAMIDYKNGEPCEPTYFLEYTCKYLPTILQVGHGKWTFGDTKFSDRPESLKEVLQNVLVMVNGQIPGASNKYQSLVLAVDRLHDILDQCEDSEVNSECRDCGGCGCENCEQY